MKAGELIEKAMILYHSLTVSNGGDCLTPYKVKIKHYSAAAEGTSHSLAEALTLAAAAMEENYPTIAERLAPERARQRNRFKRLSGF